MKKTMKILVVSQFYTPDITAAAFRIRESVDLLRASGHDVRVITSMPHKALAEGDSVSLDEQGIYRVTLTSLEGSGMRRYLLHYLSFVFSSTMKGLSMRVGQWRPDVIWTTSPPLFTGISGIILARVWRCPVVFDVRDIWPESAVAAGQLSAAGRAFKIGKSLEKRLYDGVNYITCVSKPMAEYIGSRSRTPVAVVYNGVLRSSLSEVADSKPKRRILYAGNLGRVQGLDVIVRVFAQAISENLLPGWTLEFLGSGALEAELRTLVGELGIGNRVFFHPPVRKEVALAELEKSALLFINLKSDGVFSLTIPSKVFDCMIANRPILAGITGEGRAITERTGGNIPFVPSDPKTLLEAMRRVDKDYVCLAENALQNRAVALELYSREQSVEMLISVFDRLTRGKS